MLNGKMEGVCIPLLGNILLRGNSVFILCIFSERIGIFTEFGSSYPSFNRSILTVLYFKSETSAHAEIVVIHCYILFTSFLT